LKLFLSKHFLAKSKEGNLSHPLNILYEESDLIFTYLKASDESSLVADIFVLMINAVFDVNFKKQRDENDLINCFFQNLEKV
jgi:hypothetical protein